MADEKEVVENKVGIGAKIVYGFIMLVATSLYYQILDWGLMVPVQNLPYPYK